MLPFLAQSPPAAEAPISVERLVTFEGPLELDKLLWIGGGLLLLLALLALRDALLAKRKWVVPALFTLRAIACGGVMLALSAPTSMTRKTFEQGRGLGIYLDTSASMTLSDPADGHHALLTLAARQVTSPSGGAQQPDLPHHRSHRCVGKLDVE